MKKKKKNSMKSCDPCQKVLLELKVVEQRNESKQATNPFVGSYLLQIVQWEQEFQCTFGTFHF
jgi:hypothetical protein